MANYFRDSDRCELKDGDILGKIDKLYTTLTTKKRAVSSVYDNCPL